MMHGQGISVTGGNPYAQNYPSALDQMHAGSQQQYNGGLSIQPSNQQKVGRRPSTKNHD
jgi:organic radical activating enzyme